MENAINSVKETFDRAKENEPSIIFIDEIDALVPSRDSSQEIGTQIVSQLLEEMDRLKDEGENIVVVAATNRPDTLDPALLRPGRFDKLIYVPPPEREDRVALFKEYLSKAPVGNDIDYEKLADATPGYTGADISNICRQAKMNALESAVNTGEEVQISMQDLMDLIKATRPSAPSSILSRYLMFISRYGKR